MAKLLEPHSREWFAKLQSINPAQAAMTRQMIQLSGTPHCCGICGETDDVQDYKLVSDPTMTARFCNDCVENQKRMYGLSVDPI